MNDSALKQDQLKNYLGDRLCYEEEVYDFGGHRDQMSENLQKRHNLTPEPKFTVKGRPAGAMQNDDDLVRSDEGGAGALKDLDLIWMMAMNVKQRDVVTMAIAYLVHLHMELY